MKKFLALAIVLSVSSLSAPVLTFAAPQATTTAESKPPLMTLQGKVASNGDKITFVNDKDGKTWEVINPEELKAHTGHHVELSAHVYADKMQIHVMSVKMIKMNK